MSLGADARGQIAPQMKATPAFAGGSGRAATLQASRSPSFLAEVGVIAMADGNRPPIVGPPPAQ